MKLMGLRIRLGVGGTLLLVALLCAGTKAKASSFTLDLSGTVASPVSNVGGTGNPNFTTIAGSTGSAYFQQLNDNTSSQTYQVMSSLGTGSDPTNGIAAAKSGTIQGYNDTGSTSFTTSKVGAAVTLNDLPKVKIGATTYYEIAVDFKIVTSPVAEQPVFTMLQIYANATAGIDINQISQLSTLGTKIYDLGSNTLKISAIQSTSNISQMGIYIPVSAFGALSGTTSVYAFTQITGMSGANDAVHFAWEPADSNTTPEAQTVWGGVSIALILTIGMIRRHYSS